MQKKYAYFIPLLFLIIQIQLFAQDRKPDWRKLHYLSEEEMYMPFTPGLNFIETDPPAGPIRNVAEFDQQQAALIRYPLGIPVELVREMAENIEVITIVANASQQQTALTYYENANVNTDNCTFLIAPTDSHWTRDYGPWFVFDGNNQPGIVDFPYNRPRPNDDEIPVKMADLLGIDLYGMNLIQTGGNYMTDGMGMSASTDLVIEENPDLTEVEIAGIVDDYLGVGDYSLMADPLDDYIKHIDCWGKYLSPNKVIIGQVPESDYRYEDFEMAADYFKSKISSYGKPYEVYRVYTPATEAPFTPYTNSLILNKKVLVPITGNQWDDEAIASYQEAMPGYEIIGINYTNWFSTDALHCRVIGIADIGMLYIDHIPTLGLVGPQDSYEISAEITAASGAGIMADSVRIYYSINGGEYQNVAMTYQQGNTWSGNITGVDGGDQVSYYLFAKDYSGRRSFHPFIGEADPHQFTVFGVQTDDLDFDPDSVLFETVDQLITGIPLHIINQKNHPVTIDYITPESMNVYIWWVEEMPSLPYELPANDTLTLKIMSSIPVNMAGYYLVDTMFVQVQEDVYKELIIFDSDIISSISNNLTFESAVFPNPAYNEVTFSFMMEAEGEAEVRLYDQNGKLVWNEKAWFQAGSQQINFAGKDIQNNKLNPGTYFYELVINKKEKSGKIIFTR